MKLFGKPLAELDDKQNIKVKFYLSNNRFRAALIAKQERII
jgi:hypothetical protein